MRNLIFLLIPFFLISCGNKKSTEKTPEVQVGERAKVIYDSTRSEERKLFFDKYNPSSISDSSFKYTYQLQDLISNVNGYHKVHGDIVDIIKKGDVYVLKIDGYFSNERTFLELDMTKEIYDKVKGTLDENENFLEADFIFELVDFNVSTGFKAKSVESDDFSYDIRYDFLSVTYFIKGNLVDLLPSD